MRFETSQHMRMSQQMKLAPRMIQSMEILQMPMLALQERIDQELESNVALEIVEPQVEDGERETPERDDEPLAERELVVGETPSATEDWQRLSEYESSNEEVFDNKPPSEGYSRYRMSGERDKKMDALANAEARAKSLTDVLLEQWTFVEVDDETARLGELLINYIDDDGLLGADLETILEQNRNVPGRDLSLQRLEQALKEVQQNLDPPGIGGRSRRESIIIQIDRLEAEPDRDPRLSDVRRLVEDHFDDLLQNRLPRIVEQTGLSMEQIHEAMALMHRFSINPGRELVTEDIRPIIPDILVEHDEEAGEYTATLCDGVLPTLRVAASYEKMARDRAVEKKTREFVGNSVRNAHWLIDSINQRKNTLLRVVGVVLARQRDFLDHGPQHLKPLPMIEVAEQLGIHVGTVSRAVSDKWLQTPRGLVSLRKLFTGGTETVSGQNLSWEAVKAKLKEIVDGEDKAEPLSDSALVGELKNRGIDIARRTVVKYRQQLDIPPARRRKVY
ncbi:MAG: RNA polymerase factor sigma-54 [Planctomycetota bacterium]|jgi:RNA polymerase sigma-54 factor